MSQRAIPGAGQVKGLTLGRVTLPNYDPDYMDITELYKLEGEQSYEKKALDVQKEGIKSAETSSLAAIEAANVRARKAADLKKELTAKAEAGATTRLESSLKAEGILAGKKAELKQKQDLYKNITTGAGLTLSGISLAKKFWPDATKSFFSGTGPVGSALKTYGPTVGGAGTGAAIGYELTKDSDDKWKKYLATGAGAVVGGISGYMAGDGDAFDTVLDEISGWF